MRREVLIPLELARRTMPAPLTRRPGAPARIVTLAGDTMGTSWRVTVAAVPPLDRDAQLEPARTARNAAFEALVRKNNEIGDTM